MQVQLINLNTVTSENTGEGEKGGALLSVLELLHSCARSYVESHVLLSVMMFKCLISNRFIGSPMILENMS